MDFGTHETHFSQVRMLKYFESTKDKGKAIDLYKYNILLSQSLYPLISILEVGMRNAIDAVLKKKFGPNWIIDGRNGFMIHPDMVYFDEREKRKKPDTVLIDKLLKVENRLLFDGIPLVHNKIIGDIGFGFWIKLMDSKPISILKAEQLKAFKNWSGKNQVMYSQLNDIRVLRNRISHQEPICFDRAGNLSVDSMRVHYRTVKDAIGWIDKELQGWSDNFDNCRKIVSEIEEGIVKHKKVEAKRFSGAFLAKGK
jgi:hypothetical protein